MSNTINYKVDKYLLIIIIISITYSIMMGSGIYGFGKDYHFSYSLPGLKYGLWYRDALGWRITNFHLFNVHLGVYIVSFLLAFSVGKLSHKFFKSNYFFSGFTFIILNLIIIHTWPVFMSTSNAMRQGLVMSFIYLGLCSQSSNSNGELKSFLFFFMINFLHTAGPFYFYIYLITMILRFFPFKSYKLIIPFLLLLNSIIFYFLVEIILKPDGPSKIIGYDFSTLFLVINFFFLIIFTINIYETINNNSKLFAYVFSFVSPVIYFHNFFFQFERLNMVMILLNLFLFGTYFKKSNTIIIWLISFLTLLFLTYYTGMYDSFYN